MGFVNRVPETAETGSETVFSLTNITAVDRKGKYILIEASVLQSDKFPFYQPVKLFMTLSNSAPSVYETPPVEIVNEPGLHARAATLLAQLARKAKATVWVVKDGKRADAASIIDVLTLACTKGTWISFRAEDPADRPLLAEMARSVASGFGE